MFPSALTESGAETQDLAGTNFFFAREILTLGLWSFGYYMILGQDVIRDQGMMGK